MDQEIKAYRKRLYIVFVFNLLLLYFIAFKYTDFLEDTGGFFSKVYLGLTIFSHFFMLGLITLLLGLLVFRFSKSRIAAKSVQITLSSLTILLLQLDATVFGQFRYHLTPIVFKLVFGKRATDIFQFSAINVILAVGFVVFVVLMQFFFFYISKKLVLRNVNMRIKATVFFFIFTLLTSHLVYAWSDANYYRPVTQLRNVFPVFFPLTAESLMNKLGLVDEEKAKRNKEIKGDFSSNTVQYPLQPIVSEKLAKQKNVLFIVVDTWRFNCMTADITPNIYQFSQKSQVFENHKSGSNITLGGIFSLFYGIPSTYSDTFTGQEIAPVFINELQKQQYAMKIYSSSTLENPPFNRNVFSKVPNLRLNSKGESPSERDNEITTEWLADMEKNDSSKPFFGFLFYDSAHGFDFPKEYKLVFQPSLPEVNYIDLNGDYNPGPLYNRYKNALHYVDSLVGKVLAQLEQKGLLDSTIIVITGDHGQEFNDNKKGYWQHGGNFSKYQIQTPLIVFDAAKAPKRYTHQTLHYDITPTVLSGFLGVKNKFSDYSFGKSLYDSRTKRDYFICGYNQKFAIIEKTKITNIYASGFFDVTDQSLNVLNEDPNYDLVTQGLSEMNRFFKKQ